MIEMNDTIGVMLREQMAKIIRRDDLIQSFAYDTSGTMKPPVGVHVYDPHQAERRSKGRFYGVPGGENYKLGIFSTEDELRVVLFNGDYDTLQTASMVWHSTVNGSHTAVSLREASFRFFGEAIQPMTPATDDERGNAVMKLMMINEAAR